MAAWVDTLRLLAQPELAESRTAGGTNTKKMENDHSSGLVGGAETGAGVERTRAAVAGLRLAECGTGGAGSPSTSGPCGPTSAQINREGRTQSGGEWGRQSSGVAPRAAPNSPTDKPDQRWAAKQTVQPRAPAPGNKASNL